MANIKNLEGFRKCYLCEKTFQATIEFFPRDKNRPLGIGYQCRPCAKIETKKRSKPRTEHYKNMTPEQKERKANWQKEYDKNTHFSIKRIYSYKAFDKSKNLECDLTIEWFKNNILNKPCFYCEETIERIGCDRIDNNLGHTTTNLIPCCKLCNITRMNNFTHEEMKLIGKVIKQIKQSRN